MKWLLSLCFAAAIASLPIAAEAAGNTPSAVWPALRHDFQRVVDGTSVTHDIVVGNRGSAELRIYKVETG
jgi:hypothetical protein